MQKNVVVEWIFVAFGSLSSGERKTLLFGGAVRPLFIFCVSLKMLRQESKNNVMRE